MYSMDDGKLSKFLGDMDEVTGDAEYCTFRVCDREAFRLVLKFMSI